MRCVLEVSRAIRALRGPPQAGPLAGAESAANPDAGDRTRKSPGRRRPDAGGRRQLRQGNRLARKSWLRNAARASLSRRSRAQGRKTSGGCRAFGDGHRALWGSSPILWHRPGDAARTSVAWRGPMIKLAFPDLGRTADVLGDPASGDARRCRRNFGCWRVNSRRVGVTRVTIEVIAIPVGDPSAAEAKSGGAPRPKTPAAMPAIRLPAAAIPSGAPKAPESRGGTADGNRPKQNRSDRCRA